MSVQTEKVWQVTTGRTQSPLKDEGVVREKRRIAQRLTSWNLPQLYGSSEKTHMTLWENITHQVKRGFRYHIWKTISLVEKRNSDTFHLRFMSIRTRVFTWISGGKHLQWDHAHQSRYLCYDRHCKPYQSLGDDSCWSAPKISIGIISYLLKEHLRNSKWTRLLSLAQKSNKHGSEEECVERYRSDGHSNKMHPRGAHYATFVVWTTIPDRSDL